MPEKKLTIEELSLRANEIHGQLSFQTGNPRREELTRITELLADLATFIKGGTGKPAA
jgi:hypothetical protein